MALLVQAAPFDILRVDEELSQQELEGALAQTDMWTAEGNYPLLPYSSIILEAVAEPDATPRRRGSRQAASQQPQTPQ